MICDLEGLRHPRRLGSALANNRNLVLRFSRRARSVALCSARRSRRGLSLIRKLTVSFPSAKLHNASNVTGSLGHIMQAIVHSRKGSKGKTRSLVVLKCRLYLFSAFTDDDKDDDTESSLRANDPLLDRMTGVVISKSSSGMSVNASACIGKSWDWKAAWNTKDWKSLTPIRSSFPVFMLVIGCFPWNEIGLYIIYPTAEPDIYPKMYVKTKFR